MIKPLIQVYNDSQEMLSLFEAILTSEGYAVRVGFATDFDLNALRANPPDLIISDYSRRRGQGEPSRNLLRHLKHCHDTSAIPVLISTTDPHPTLDDQPQHERGKIAVLGRPFNIEELLLTIENLLDSHRLAS